VIYLKKEFREKRSGKDTEGPQLPDPLSVHPGEKKKATPAWTF
jgi:hypothetical protein